MSESQVPSSLWTLRTLAAWGYPPPTTTHPGRKLEDSYLEKQNTPREKSSKYWHSVFTDTKWYWHSEIILSHRIFPWTAGSRATSYLSSLASPSKKATNLLQYNILKYEQTKSTGSKSPLGITNTKLTKETQWKSREWREKKTLNVYNWYP